MTDNRPSTPPAATPYHSDHTAAEFIDTRNDRRRSSDSGECSSSGSSLLEVDEELKSKPPADEIVALLEDLWLSRPVEPPLSEAQLSINDQLQQDELLALEAIYGDNVVILDKRGALQLFQINIVNEVPSKHNVSADLSSFAQESMQPEGESCDNTGHQDGFLYTFDVQYLPPLLLTCLLPSSCPSHSSPCFTVYADWLSPTRISDLCLELDKIWVENSGQEIFYQWVDWLHVSSLSFLNVDGAIRLGPYRTIGEHDRRAISGSVAPDADILNMIHFNEQKCSEAFLKSFHDCCICFSECEGTDFVKLPCKHYFCNTCMETYVRMHVKEGTVLKLVCLENKCNDLIPPVVLERLLGKDEFERWESLLLQRTLDSMADLVYCPRCETPCLEDEGHDAQCSKCLFSFCSLCKDRRHVGYQCLAPESKLQILEVRQEATNIDDIQKQKEREIMNELLSLTEILHTTKQCPHCKMAIFRISGCDIMLCHHCSTNFCYRYTQPLDNHDRYICQLSSPKIFTSCKRPSNERIRNKLQMVSQIRTPIDAECRLKCPYCGQMNSKAGNNNHIICWSCQNNFCALCLKDIHRPSHHFRPSGCKQHT